MFQQLGSCLPWYGDSRSGPGGAPGCVPGMPNAYEGEAYVSVALMPRTKAMTHKGPLKKDETDLLHEVSTALAIARGRAQLLHRHASRLDRPLPPHFLLALEAIDTSVMRAHKSLIDYLSRERLSDNHHDIGDDPLSG